MNSHTMSTEQFETNCATIKDMIVGQLFREGKVSEEVYNEYTTHYSVILKAPSKFNVIWSKLTSAADEVRFIIVKNISMVDCSTDDVITSPPKKTLEKKIINLFSKDPSV